MCARISGSTHLFGNELLELLSRKLFKYDRPIEITYHGCEWWSESKVVHGVSIG